jgi:adenylosuccinate lyase
VFQLVHLVLDLLQPTKGSESRFVDCRTGFEVDVLVQQAELHVTGADDVAAIRSVIASDETKDRALASAVATDESDVLARVYL